MPEKGILSFIKLKMESSVKSEDIKRMLVRAGFGEKQIDGAFEYIKKTHKETHQDVAASNDFLPILKKGLAHLGRGSKESLIDESERVVHEVQKGLFVGRLRRKDFVLGFLFFFGIGYVILAFSTVLISTASPHLWQTIIDTIQSDTSNMLFMLLPVILAPITVIMLSLISRRLHNLGLSGGLSFMFLAFFLPSFGEIYKTGFIALQIALLILFIVLVTVKGNPAPNVYGPLPGSKGSFFKRILNI